MDNSRLANFVFKKTDNQNIIDAFYKANRYIQRHRKIMCSISGGADSDIMLDLLTTLDDEGKIIYVFFDTGLETQATKRHIKELENKYKIKILPIKASKPIPVTCKEYGQPFLSKQVSEWISRLQRHNFKWEDRPLDELKKEYPNCIAALRWWCNDWELSKTGQQSRYNIAYNTYLKEFMILNPPTFKISNKCCYYAKKKIGVDFAENNDFDLSCTGIRKAEGGARAGAYTSCFTPKPQGIDQYRPVFWFDKFTKLEYKQKFEIKHSDCYEIWGLERTGCPACPFGLNFEYELECLKIYEPQLYLAANNIFGDSYEYTRKYREFQQRMGEAKDSIQNAQM